MKLLFSLFCVLFQGHLTDAYTYESLNHIPNCCLDLLKGGEHTNGYYNIAWTDGKILTVYCDFTSEPGSAWTLVMSWAFANELFAKISLTENFPVNDRSPNWNIYRMSEDQMEFLKSMSTHWRATCKFDEIDVDYTDYMRGNFIDFDITSFEGSGICMEVEYINVRGNEGGAGTARFWQNGGSLLHTDSYWRGDCDFDGTTGAATSEDNFGSYHTVNSAFRCTSSPTATTQYWFGGYL